MLDKHIIPRTKPILGYLARQLAKTKLQADHLTMAGFVVGLLCVPLLATGHNLLALICLLINRLVDGLDGELARLRGSTDAGALLDITLDFVFYGLFPVGFALADPSINALPSALLVASFVGTGSSFLAFSIFAERHHMSHPDFPWKGLYYLNGLMEGSETILFFMLMCIFPTWFVPLAIFFAVLCMLTTFSRITGGYLTLKAMKSPTQS